MSNKPESEDLLEHRDDLFDLSTSCTKEQAVMRLLGWGTGDFHKRYIQVTENGISPEDLRQAHPTTLTLSERLDEMIEQAYQALIHGAENGASDEELDCLHEEVAKARQLAPEARKLLIAIDYELAKEDGSFLRLDREATKRSGVSHINIQSLEEWAATPSSDDVTDGRRSQKPEKTKPRRKMLEQDDAILRVIEKLGHTPGTLPPNDPGKLGVKAKVKEALAKNPLFEAGTSFEKAWDRRPKTNPPAEKT